MHFLQMFSTHAQRNVITGDDEAVCQRGISPCTEGTPISPFGTRSRRSASLLGQGLPFLIIMTNYGDVQRACISFRVRTNQLETGVRAASPNVAVSPTLLPFPLPHPNQILSKRSSTRFYVFRRKRPRNYLGVEQSIPLGTLSENNDISDTRSWGIDRRGP